MVANTKIEWSDKTWNIVRGCQWVNGQCQNCYAMGIAYRFSGNGQPYEGLAHMTNRGIRWTGKIKLVHELLKEPMKWKKPQRVFVNSMSDLFHDDVPFKFLYKAFETMLLTPRHTYQILSKRPQRMRKVMEDINFHLGRNYPDIELPLRNVWLGVSAGTQKSADEFIPLLLETSAAIRFVSCEPLLEAVNLSAYLEKTFCCHAHGCGYMGDDCHYLHYEKYWHSHDYDREEELCYDCTDTFPNDDEDTEQCCPECHAVEEFGHVENCCDIHNDHQEYPALDWVIVGAESGHGARPMNEEWASSLQWQCQSSGTSFFYKQKLDEKGKKVSLPVLNGRPWAEFPRVEAR